MSLRSNDIIKFKLYRNEKIPFRIQIREINVFVVGRIRPFFLATNEKDEEIRNKYVDVLLKYYKRTIHQKNKDVEDVLLIMYSMNVIKLISASLIIKEYENILSAKIDIVMEKVYKREKYLLKVIKIDFKKEIREVIEKIMKKLRI